ncbi:putative HNHc nuclease [Secundilactobacillus pentosiphilus]|uniref:putative HNHc nuclease n=1 Tax=Secundilactobacillus pentosiphilus TaxID=1714682 RepID=UPI0015E12B2A|nr:putative HNHc nuclease [Secundilactobacillus pentosiphilus]
MQLTGRVTEDNDGQYSIKLDPESLENASKIDATGYHAVLDIELIDRITMAQRAKIYALIGEIADFAGYRKRSLELKQSLKKMFMDENDISGMFSLSDCSKQIASDFLEYLIGFCFEWNIPFASSTVDAIREQPRWDFYCLKYRKCTICGEHADIAHVHAVGIGRDRDHISHVGNSVMALCRKHHIEQHTIGIHNFMNKYHTKGLKVTPEIAEMLKLGNFRTVRGEDIISTKEG